jgi:glycosyltransferase involved in cell wall biosynthesis
MPKSICFVGLDNYPVLNRFYGDRYFGGESVQQTMLARAFRDLGYDVSMVVLDYGQPDGEILDGIRVLKTYRENAGIPILRFFHPRTSSVFSALRRANSQIYFQSCSAGITGFVAWHCRRNHRSFIYRVASDGDCVAELPLIRYNRDRALYRFGLKHADLIAAQSYHQQKLLAQSFNQPSVVVKMAVEIPPIVESRQLDFDVLWINNLRPLKRPHQVLRLAERLPQYRFAMIGGAVPGSESLYEEVAIQAKTISNLAFLGPLPYHEAGEYFLRSRLFINTSEIEGFPNSMLQAWAAGLPVISYFDPDGLNTRLKLGNSPTDMDEMAHSIRDYLENARLREQTGARAREYVASNHAPEAVAKQYIVALDT